MLRKLGAIATTVFITNGSDSRVALKLVVLLGVFVGALLLQVCVYPPCIRALLLCSCPWDGSALC